MKARINTRIDKIDADLEKLLAFLSIYSEHELNKRPNEKLWSVMQALHHVRLGELYSIGYCKKKLSFNPELPNAGIISPIRRKLISLAMRSPIKFKAPPGMDISDLPERDKLENLINLWRKERLDLRKFVDLLPNKYLNKLVYKHPVGGRLSIEDMVRFFEDHFYHHQKQINYILALVKGEKA